jgi:catechol 2,3-dioxygenase-like lactoylglutathione lyase family enzyme
MDTEELPPDGPDIGGIQGLPGASVQILWAVDQQDFFQLEFFEYREPSSTPLRSDWRACDIGYTRVGIHVADFDATLKRLGEIGTSPLTAPIGRSGQRRVCVRDPDGVILELMEDSPPTPSPVVIARPELSAQTRSVTISVPDLARSARFFRDILGMRPAPSQTLHTADHEQLWGLEGARAEVELLWSGNFWVELVQYHAPLGTPRSVDYRISDQGIINLALGSRSHDSFRRIRDAVLADGHVAHDHYADEGVDAQYIEDDQGFSVELLGLDRSVDPAVGFTPAV